MTVLSKNLKKAVKVHHKLRFEQMKDMSPKDFQIVLVDWNSYALQEVFLPKFQELCQGKMKFGTWQDYQRKIELIKHELVQRTIEKIAYRGEGKIWK